jgi:hypothetical protein
MGLRMEGRLEKTLRKSSIGNARITYTEIEGMSIES